MRLVRKLIDWLDAERRAQVFARRLRDRGVAERDVLRLARLAAYHPLAELRGLERQAPRDADRDRTPWLIGRALSLRPA